MTDVLICQKFPWTRQDLSNNAISSVRTGTDIRASVVITPSRQHYELLQGLDCRTVSICTVRPFACLALRAHSNKLGAKGTSASILFLLIYRNTSRFTRLEIPWTGPTIHFKATDHFSLLGYCKFKYLFILNSVNMFTYPCMLHNVLTVLIDL